MKGKQETNDQPISERLINWYLAHHRSFPWRETVTPYRVWISEIMLQQTRIETVIRYFDAFMTAFPTITTLADSDLEKVYRIWAGLGYYQRAKNIWKTAQILKNRYAGTVPDEYEALIHLPGIGAYTASAILSIAFNQPYPAVDGNVLRVVTRMKGWFENVLDKKTVLQVTQFLNNIVPTEHCSEFTQAWMELGETHCSKQSPDCVACPLESLCYARIHAVTDKLPVRIKDRQRAIENRAVFFIQPSPKELVITKKRIGLLAELWELPNFEFPKDFSQNHPPKQLSYPGLPIEFTYIASLKHDFTHKRWNLFIYQGKIKQDSPMDPDWQIIQRDALDQYPMATAFTKVRKLFI
ncbi:A/G-specific adenine glycosylase [bacterium]|nr:A/G-specific adenine glycosylase [bacterium]